MDNKTMKQEMLEEQLIENLQDYSDVKFTFRKANGEIRIAHGTLSANALKYYLGELKEGTGKQRDGVIVYYDIEKKAFRAMKKGNLISIDSKE